MGAGVSSNVAPTDGIISPSKQLQSKLQSKGKQITNAVLFGARIEAQRVAAAARQEVADAEAVSSAEGRGEEAVNGDSDDGHPPLAHEEILKWLNFARQKPKAFAKKLEARLAGFDGLIYTLPGRPRPFKTVEGVKAVKEAVAFCKKVAPLSTILRLDATISMSALDHAEDLGSAECKRNFGHTGSDDSNMQERNARYGRYGSCGEVIGCQPPYSTAQELVEDLIIDDNVKSRSHRKTIYHEDCKFDACGIGVVTARNLQHLFPEYPDAPWRVCVIDFASKWSRHEAKASAREQAGAWTPNWIGDVEFMYHGCARDSAKISKKGTCAGCKSDIRGGKVIVHNGVSYHRECWECKASGCKEGIGGEPEMLCCCAEVYADGDGRCICMTCHKSPCAHCGQTITATDERVSINYNEVGVDVLPLANPPDEWEERTPLHVHASCVHDFFDQRGAQCIYCNQRILDGVHVQADEPWFVCHRLCGRLVEKNGPLGDPAKFTTDPKTVEYEKQNAENAEDDRKRAKRAKKYPGIYSKTEAVRIYK